MSDLSVQALIDSGAHIGCRVGRWNPKMAPYILESRNRIHIIDLKQTIRGLLRAKHFLKQIVAEGNDVLLVGTKLQLSGELAKINVSTGMPYVEDRWIGGTLTNYEVIGSRIAYLEELEAQEADGHLDTLTKKEAARFMREKRKVYRNLNGIRSMNRIPGAMVVIDPKTEMKAVAEAKKMGVPVIGIIDTDGDPDVCDLIIPANDDAIRSVAMIMDHLADGINAGKEIRVEKGVANPQDSGNDAQPVGKGAPVPRPRAAKSGARRRPSRKDLAAANQQVEIKSIGDNKSGAEATPAEATPTEATPTEATPTEATPADNSGN